jgi:hypothetical protein
MLKNPTSMKEILCRQDSAVIACQVSPALQLNVSPGNCQIVLVDESGTIINHMETYNRSEMFTVQGSPFAPTT